MDNGIAENARVAHSVNVFRPEYLSQRADRLSGTVSIAIPVAWQAISYLIFGALLATLLFLSLAEYSRVEVAVGKIEPDKGVVGIVPTRTGVVTTLFVHNGQVVPEGASLATIKVEENVVGGSTVATDIEAAIGRQNASLTNQISSANAAALAQREQLAVQRTGLRAEIGQIETQAALERKLIDSAEDDYDRAKSVAARGFISGRDLQQRADAILTRRQQLSQLEQSLASKHAALTQLDRDAAQIAAQAKLQIAGFVASKAQIDQLMASTRGGRAYVLRAPLAGTVTALVGRVGQSTSPQTALMAVIPAGSVLRAELAVPSSAIGFVKVGMEVNLAIEAFPYTRFGTVKGKVLTVASSSVTRTGPNGGPIDYYPATVALRDDIVRAYGRPEKLIAGMSLTARIVTERRSILQWLFDPLFAARDR